jgi:hypothetical protein
VKQQQELLTLNAVFLALLVNFYMQRWWYNNIGTIISLVVVPPLLGTCMLLVRIYNDPVHQELLLPLDFVLYYKTTTRTVVDVELLAR